MTCPTRRSRASCSSGSAAASPPNVKDAGVELRRDGERVVEVRVPLLLVRRRPTGWSWKRLM
jgi:hypothetical protein